MKKIFYILFASLLVISCSSDNEDSATPIDKETIVTEGKQVFRIDLKAITAKGLSVGNQKNLEPAFVLVSIYDDDGNSILTREKVALNKVADSYVTAEISLEAGTYSLTEFIVTDENDVVISLAPQEDSVLAQFASSPVPFDFVVSPDQTKETTTENINAAGYTSVDFGYTELSLTFPESTDYFSLTVDDSNVLTTKVLNIKSITGSTYLVDWGDGLIEEYTSTILNSGIENVLSHSYSDNGIYDITISGAVAAIELLDFGSDQENNWYSHLTAANIDKLTLLKTCQLYTGNLSTLNISENLALETISLGGNQLTSIDISNNPNLKTVRLRYNKLTELDVTQNHNLEFLSITGNEISSVNLSQNSNLIAVLARENNLSSIDFSSNLNLERFDLSDNSIANIDISTNQSLIEINVGANLLTTIDLSKNANLKRIDLYSNQITAIDLSANLKLRDVYIDNNLLTDIDVAANPDLERLYIKNNNLNSLDISLNPKISHLNIGENQFNASQLDQILSQIYDYAVQNSIMNGYVHYRDNPGSEGIAATTIAKLNDLISSNNWSFNNG